MNAAPDVAISAAAGVPSLDRLLKRPEFTELLAGYGHQQVVAALREQLDVLRRAALRGDLGPAALGAATIAGTVARTLSAANRASLRPVFNLTGTVLHTNLGRALLPDEAVRAVVSALTQPQNLEFDLAGGRRGERDGHIETLLCELTGADAATVVNNNAAAVLLVVNALANRRDVIVSRGELIEIGGSFRLPEIMRQAGARLREVGTTNRTHAADYADAIGPRTALLLKAHTSNYAISGFTASVAVEELAAIARARRVPLAVDLGSGTLVDLAAYGLPHESTVRDTIAAGADLVTFSGDKLLGGPQAGLIVGRNDLIARLRKHPLKRALRVGKLTLAALEAVLQLYRAPEFLTTRLTTLRLLTRPNDSIRAQCERVLAAVCSAVGSDFVVCGEPMLSQVGSGALPVENLPSHGLAIRAAPGNRRRGALDRLEAGMRALPRPVLGRIADRTLWLDLRCLEQSEEAEFTAQWSRLGT